MCKEITRGDVFCLDDIKFFKLKHKGMFGNSNIYCNDNVGVLLKEITDYETERLYKVDFTYKK